MEWRIVVGWIVAGVGLLLAHSGSCAAPQIWFAPPDDMRRPGQVRPGSDDFSALFAPDAAWQRAAAKTAVFSIGSSYFAEHASDEQLSRIFRFLSSRQIRLSVTLEAVFATGCGGGIEGIVGTRTQPGDIARRLKGLGAAVDSFAFDEPLDFAHLYAGPRACRFPVEEVARRVAYTVSDVRTSYPDAKFVDYEDVTSPPSARWPGLLRQWLDAYRRATGRPLDGLVLDINWTKPWSPAARAAADILHSQQVPVGFFLDGGWAVTDALWTEMARRYALAVDAAGIMPDIAVVASWMPHPRRMLPETDPTTLTSLIDWYAARPR